MTDEKRLTPERIAEINRVAVARHHAVAKKFNELAILFAEWKKCYDEGNHSLIIQDDILMILNELDDVMPGDKTQYMR